MKHKQPKRINIATLILSMMVLSMLAGVYNLAARGALKIDCNLADLENYNIESINLNNKVTDIFGRSMSPAIIVAKDLSEDRNIVTALRKHIENNPDSSFTGPIGLSSLYPRDEQTKKEILQKILKHTRLAPEDKLKDIAPEIANIENLIASQPLTREMVPNQLVRKFLPKDPGSTLSLVMVSPSEARDTPERIHRFADEIAGIKLPNGKHLKPVGEFILMSDMLRMISHDAPIILIFSLASIFFILWVCFKDINIALLIMLTTFISFFCTVLAMMILGLKLDIFNIVVFPVVLGTGVDSAIHIYRRYLNHGKQPIFTVIRHLRSSLSMAAGTTFLGFGALIFAQHGGLKSMGWLAMLSMSVTFMVTLVVLPQLIQMTEKVARIKLTKAGKTVDLAESA